MPLDGSEFKFEVSETTKALIEGRRLVEISWFGFDPKHAGAPQNGHCAVFAISRQNIGDLTLPALAYVARAIYGSDDPSGIQPWNDVPGRTKEEVLKVYDDAIEASLSGNPTPTPSSEPV